jgi:capsular exopolysaccharide synthesis family protein
MSDFTSENIPPQPFNSVKSELFNLSLRDLFYKYVRFLPVFILAVSFALFAAFIYLRYATKYYSVGGSMLIKIESQSNRSDKFEDLFNSNKALNLSSEIEVLKSVPLMERVVKNLKLNTSYFAVGKIKTSNIYGQCPFIFDAFVIKDSSRSFTLTVNFKDQNRFTVNSDNRVFKMGDICENPNSVFRLQALPGATISGNFLITWQPTNFAAIQYAGGMQVLPKTIGTGILNLSMITTNSQLGANIINQIMLDYDTLTIQEKNLQSDRALKFINERIDTFQVELDAAQEKLLRFKQVNHFYDENAQFKNLTDQVTGSDIEINKSQLLINSVELIEKYMGNKNNEFKTFDLVPTSLGLDDATLISLVDNYNRLQLERKSFIESKVAVNNPALVEKISLIDDLRIKILESLRNLKQSFADQIRSVKRRGSDAEEILSKMPEKFKELKEIEREVLLKQELYDVLLKKREETAISRASQISNSKFLNKAAATTVPVKPNKRAIQILAILMGIGLPAMFVFVREVFNDKIATRFDIEKITPAPILGEVGHSYSENALVVTKVTRKMVAEQFRIIRSNLQYVMGKGEKSVILVSSSFSGEGKSFISTNIGAVMSLAGKKTIILEFDIRKPKILSGLGMQKKPGITNFLVGKAGLEELPLQVPGYENLFVFPCGPVPPNPSELLLDKKVEEIFIWLKSRFDLIVIDTAPVGMVSDAQTLGKFADCTLYIVRQGHTFKKQVALIDEFYQQQKLPKVSIIINDVKIKPGYGYYGYGRYGYGYGYGGGYGYYEEETPKGSFIDKILKFLYVRKLFGKRK